MNPSIPANDSPMIPINTPSSNDSNINPSTSNTKEVQQNNRIWDKFEKYAKIVVIAWFAIVAAFYLSSAILKKYIPNSEMHQLFSVSSNSLLFLFLYLPFILLLFAAPLYFLWGIYSLFKSGGTNRKEKLRSIIAIVVGGILSIYMLFALLAGLGGAGM